MTQIPWTKKKYKIAIIGDIMLDEYLKGSVRRISPEAPVPIHHVESVKRSLGGAANVALNIKLCGAEVDLISVIGEDQTAIELNAELIKNNIHTHFILKSILKPTIKKTRLMAGSQQLLRLDWEDLKPINEEIQNHLFEYLKKSSPDGIIISDYGKGMLSKDFIQRVITFAKEKGIFVSVDPKGTDFEKYHGCDLITPNLDEAKLAVGFSADPLILAQNLQTKFNLKNILITLGSQGMAYLNEKQEFLTITSRAREVYDVSGAGDTVISLVTLALVAQEPIESALFLANMGAGLVVEKMGTQPITLEELENELLNSHVEINTKIVNLNQLKNKLENKPYLKTVFTNGCFDILHKGHVLYLEEAKKLGDLLIVAINSDRSIKEVKGPKRPIVDQDGRAHLLAALSSVDYVIIFDDPTPIPLLKEIRPNILVKGADYTVDQVVGKDLIENFGGEVRVVKFSEGYSSSSIIRKCAQIV